MYDLIFQYNVLKFQTNHVKQFFRQMRTCKICFDFNSMILHICIKKSMHALVGALFMVIHICTHINIIMNQYIYTHTEKA